LICLSKFTDKKRDLVNPEKCIKADSKSRQIDVQALGEMMQHLMEKGDPSRWSKDVVQFKKWTMTKSAEQIAEVRDFNMPVV
jgi:hypothetical protein